MMQMQLLILSEFQVYLDDQQPVFRLQYFFEKAKQKMDERRKQQNLSQQKR